MQEEGSAKKGLNPALERHWDKLVLAAVAVGFVIFLGSQFSSGKAAAGKSVDGASKAFATKRGSPNPSFESPKPPPAVVQPAPVLASKPQDWTVGLPTSYSYDIKGPETAVAVGFFLPKLTLSAPQPSVEGVELRWSVSGEPEQGDKSIKVPPASFFYQIERRKKGAPGWDILVKELKSSSRYVDQGTNPKTEYEYKVTLGSSDPAWVAKNPGRLSSKVGGPFAATTPGIWEFQFSNVTPADIDHEPDPIPATAYVKIVKYDPEYGRVEWSKIHKDKSALGESDGTTKHTAWSAKKGKTVEVDFKSGAKIVSIEADKLIPYEYKVCDLKPGPIGLVCSGTETKKDHFRAHIIKYKDEEGKDQQVQWASGAAPTTDKLCPDHGGTPAPRALTPEEIAAAKEREIETLLNEADRLWSSDQTAERKKAQEIYLKLLTKANENYPAVKSRRTELIERSKKKIE